MPNHITLTRAMCYAIGMDAGNAHAKRNGRKHWTREEWNVASRAINELLDKVDFTEEGRP